MRTVWEDTVSPGDLRALEPVLPEDLPRGADVVVVGAGVAGLAVAAACVREGLAVAVVERDRPAAGPSGSAAGGLAPDAHLGEWPAPLHTLARRSLTLHRELDAEHPTGMRSADWLVVLPSPSEGPGFSREDLPAPLRSLDAVSARAMEPELGEVGGAVLLPRQALVHPLRLCAALARRGGRAVRAEATGFRAQGSKVLVETAAGAIRAEAVVVATGTVPSWLAPGVPQSLIKGHLLATEPAPFRLRCTLASPRILVLQLPCGRLVAGGTLELGDQSPQVSETALGEVLAELHALLPRSRPLAVTHRWCCFRPATSDLLPVVDRVAEQVWVVAGLYRTGLLLAPAIGEAVASWVTTGRRPAALEPLAASRFDAPRR